MELMFLLSSSKGVCGWKAEWIFSICWHFQNHLDCHVPLTTRHLLHLHFPNYTSDIGRLFSNYRFHVTSSGEHLLSIRFYPEEHSDKIASVSSHASIGLVSGRVSSVFARSWLNICGWLPRTFYFIHKLSKVWIKKIQILKLSFHSSNLKAATESIW